jgi:RES domain-containing protein
VTCLPRLELELDSMTQFRQQHPDTDGLRRGIERCLNHVVPFTGTMCRAVSTQYANSTDLLTGTGAKEHGGRWNPPGLFPAIYGTLDPYAALAETLGTYGHYQIPFEQRLPLVLVAIEVRLQRLLDLTDGGVRRQLGVSAARMLDADWQVAQSANREGLTQAIGRLAWEAKVEALLVSSARFKGEKNLVIFPDRLSSASWLKIANRHNLPESR